LNHFQRIWFKFPSIDWGGFENHSLQAPLDSSGIRSFEIAQKWPKNPLFMAEMTNLLRNPLPKAAFWLYYNSVSKSGIGLS
jgi:hypothetical protein